MITNNKKKVVANNWSDNFSDLSIYAQNKLYKICGPFLLGIEILSLPRTEDYRPIFVCYPLWKADIRQCLEEPVFIQEIYNKKGFQFNIPYEKHLNFFYEALECTKEQVPILGHQYTSVRQLFEVFNKQFTQTLIKSSPVGQAKLFEAKLLGGLYVNDLNIVKQVFTELNEVSMSWSPKLFEWKYGKLDVWLQNLQQMIVNRIGFLKQIETNKQDKKVAKLHYSELTV
ncbi:hypothetical protein ACR78Z_05295 [Sphingobacterium thalpophilum]|uniref:Uncharacterized protein n=1 Tax=Sphingobacterium thalpophilum TaxID=259 RepID=A0A4U9W270_9SPHI|nr:hypothetical protein [Sphingobacterium thalpophilum]VTR52735.1 Uncharacterised protein [Sphingobacterium thalpophilum]